MAEQHLAVARLDDATLLLTRRCRRRGSAAVAAVQPLRAAIDRYIATVAMTSDVRQAAEAPPLPDVERLAGCGVPVVGEAAFRSSATAVAERRSALRRLVLSAGRSWEPVRR